MPRAQNQRVHRSNGLISAVLLAAVITLIGQMTPAEAHNSEGKRQGRLFGSPTFCTFGTVVQNHGYHWVETSAWGGDRSCDRGAANTSHTQYQQYYKTAVWGQPGTYCGFEGWHMSGGGQPSFVKVYNWDIWHMPCNNGGGVNVWISIDSWQYSAWNGVWNGGVWRPATAHCHCP